MTNTKRNTKKDSLVNANSIEKKLRQSYRSMHWAIIGITVLLTILYIFLLDQGAHAN